MHPIRSIDLDRLPEIRAALNEWLHRARERFHLERIYLFGSFALGRPHEGSDIDLILVGPFSGKLPDRIVEVLGTTDLPIQPLCYTPLEWDALVAAENPLATEVLRSGRPWEG